MEENQTINPSTMPSNKQIRHEALGHLKGNWLYAVLCTLLFSAVMSITGSIPIAGLLVALPLAFGYSIAFLLFIRGEVDSEDLVTKPFGVFNRYGRMLGASLLVAVFTFLWSLLLIIPGIVKGYSYARTPYVAHDNPELPVRECLRRSQQLMSGYKMKLFLLDLSFIGWILLGIITCGIGMLWVNPYMTTARAEFYERRKAIEK